MAKKKVLPKKFHDIDERFMHSMARIAKDHEDGASLTNIAMTCNSKAKGIDIDIDEAFLEKVLALRECNRTHTMYTIRDQKNTQRIIKEVKSEPAEELPIYSEDELDCITVIFEE